MASGKRLGKKPRQTVPCSPHQKKRLIAFANAETRNVAVLRREPQCVERNQLTAGPGRARNSCARTEFSHSQKGEPGASETVSSNSRTSPSEEQESTSSQTSSQSSTDAALSSAQLTENSLALSTRQKGSGHRKLPGPEPSSAFSAGDEAWSPSLRQASRAGAPANGSTRARRVEIRLLRGVRFSLETLCSGLDFPFGWLFAGVLWSEAFVQKLSQPRLAPKLVGDELQFVSLREETLGLRAETLDEAHASNRRSAWPFPWLCNAAWLIRCSTDRPAVSWSMALEGFRGRNGLQDWVQLGGGHRRAVHQPIPSTTFAAELVGQAHNDRTCRKFCSQSGDLTLQVSPCRERRKKVKLLWRTQWRVTESSVTLPQQPRRRVPNEVSQRVQSAGARVSNQGKLWKMHHLPSSFTWQP